eukprot:24595-Hanusia_phi.AAC.2
MARVAMLVLAVMGGARESEAGAGRDMAGGAAMFHGLSMIVQCKGPMQLCILKAKVAENGGKVVEAGGDADLVCCETDKGRDEILSLRFGTCSQDEQERRLQQQGILAVSIKWLYACLKQEEKVDWKPFVLLDEQTSGKHDEGAEPDKVAPPCHALCC